MAAPLTWLTNLKSSQLKTLANALGINSSGTKPNLISTLQDHLPKGLWSQDDRYAKQKQEHSIISIDMGIRNLAYCRLTLPPTFPSTSKKTDVKPIITEWARIAISKRALKSENPEETSKVKEAFDPATYSHYAYKLITTLLNTNPPSQVLIERQRFRSMGGSAVQEWTLRVNMFEAMLYAVLKTLFERGAWHGSVHAIPPAKVSKFWLGDPDGATVEDGVKGSKSAKSKAAKVELVGSWLEVRERFGLEGRAKEWGEAYVRKRKGGRGVEVVQEEVGGSGELRGEIGKLDDLADCLLQGMAWVRWEENRKRILEGGLGALGELGGG